MTASKIERAPQYFIMSILLLPILFQYMTPLKGFTYGDLILCMSLLYYISKNNYATSKSILVIILYVIILTLICIINGTLVKITTTLHYLIYLIAIYYMPKLWEYRDYIFDKYKKISLISAILLLTQYVLLKTIGFSLPGVLTFMPLTDPELADYAGAVFRAGRCMSFFAEPSHYALYVLPSIILFLFLNKARRYDVCLAIFITVTLILCASFTGIMGAILLWSIYVVLNILKGQFSFKYLLLFAIAFLVFSYVIQNTSAGEYLLNSEAYERQSEGRLEGFSVMNIIKEGTWSYYIGSGMNEIGELVYLPGWPRLLYNYGVFGAVLYTICLFSCARIKSISIIVLSLLSLLMVGSEVNFGCFFVIYMILIFATKYLPIKSANYE